MNPNVDLSQLAVSRDEAPATRPAPRRRLLTRYVLPGVVLLGFFGTLAWSARGTLLPSRPVTVMPVLTTRAETQQAGTPVFQAAGWVEPRPTPTVVTALAEGVLEQLLVVEGQEVKAGEPVATLIEADPRLALAAAAAELRLREADLTGAQAVLTAARVKHAHPAHLQATLAEAEALLARGQTELANLPFQLRTAESRQWLAKLDFENKSKAKGSLADGVVNIAQSELARADAAVEELKGRKALLESEVGALARKRDALAKQLELKTDEVRQLGEAGAGVVAGEARVQLAKNAVEVAELRLARMTVRSPRAGRVLALTARPGTRVVGLSASSLQDASTVATLYDPQSLQVRADVPLDQVTRVFPGQLVRIETDAVPGTLEGEVLLKTSQADVQKNTLQVKVAVKNPPADLRPDVLVRLTFLAPASPKAESQSAERLRLLVPRQLVEAGEGGTRVWVADQAAGVARARAVKLAPGSGELAEVIEGLSETDRLIVGGREGLKDGERIFVTGEDATQGVAPAGTQGGPKVKRSAPDAAKKAKS